MHHTKTTHKLLASKKVSDSQIESWQQSAALMAAIETISADGASVVVKLDGARTNGNTYTVIISSQALGDEFFHQDGGDLLSLLAAAIDFYEERVWSKVGS